MIPRLGFPAVDARSVRCGSVWLCRGQSRGILSEQAVTREESQPALPAIGKHWPTMGGPTAAFHVIELEATFREARFAVSSLIQQVNHRLRR